MTETPDAPDTPGGRPVAGNADLLQKIGDDYRSGSGQPEEWPEGSEPQSGESSE